MSDCLTEMSPLKDMPTIADIAKKHGALGLLESFDMTYEQLSVRILDESIVLELIETLRPLASERSALLAIKDVLSFK